MTNLEDKDLGGDISLMSIVIPKAEDRPEYTVSSLIFNDYQQDIHKEYIDRFIDNKQFNFETDARDSEWRWCCCNGIKNRCIRCCGQDGETVLHPTHLKYTPLATGELDDGSEIDLNQSLRRSTTEFKGVHHHTKLMGLDSFTGTERKRIRFGDPFIQRNIKIELSDTLRTFNLMSYGQPLISCVMSMIQKQSRES